MRRLVNVDGLVVGYLARQMGFDRRQMKTTRTLAFNQGFYNAGVALLLAWSLMMGLWATSVAMLIFVAAMGIIGALSAHPVIFLVQSGPALLALASLSLG